MSMMMFNRSSICGEAAQTMLGSDSSLHQVSAMLIVLFLLVALDKLTCVAIMELSRLLFFQLLFFFNFTIVARSLMGHFGFMLFVLFFFWH